MQIGFQTIIYGPRIDDLERALDDIADAGYQGVEFAQRPEFLAKIETLLELLEERQLALVGLAGGTLQERVDFCGAVRPEYLYVEKWDHGAAVHALDSRFKLALHPHLYKSVHRLSDALDLLSKHLELKFLPDTAHLTIAGDDPVEAIRLGKDRLAAVHLKDWTPEYGRSSHRYARGFVELGKGIVKLGSVLKELAKIRYNGWLIVEQDTTRTDPATSMRESAEWLAERGLLAKRLRSRRSRTPQIRFVAIERTCHPDAEVRFLRDVIRAGAEGVGSCYSTIATAFSHLVPCDLVTVWTCSPAEDLMSLVAVKGSLGSPIRSTLIAGEALSGATIERQTVTHFDLTDERIARRFGDQQILKTMKIRKMVSLPVLNPWNANHVRLIVNLFPSISRLPVTDDELFEFGQHVALAADSTLDELCSYAAASASTLAGRSKHARDFLQSITSLIQRLVNCEGVAVFLVNDSGDKLELYTSTATDWVVSSEEQFYRKGEGLTGRVWERNEPFLTADARVEKGWKGKSAEKVESPDKHNTLTAPIVKPNGEIIGVVRCRNKRAAGSIRLSDVFSDDDAAILDSIDQAAVPHLEVLLSQERRARALGRLTHELKVPIIAIRGAAEFILRTPGVESFFDYNYPRDIWSWSELMRRLLDKTDVLRYYAEGIKVQPSRTLLRADVIAPAVRQVELLLREHNLPLERIHYGTFEQIPPLWIDRNQFQQVMFNLLSNAIKYCDNPKNFRVEIDGEKRGEEFVIWFRDLGPGIPNGMEEAVFEEGFRGPTAIEKDVTGQGLGCWVVRQVIEAHGGRVKVTNNHLPTEFMIYLPKNLS